MRKTIGMLALISLMACGGREKTDDTLILPEFKDIKLEYPETYQDGQSAEVFFGKTVPGPYHWLEAEGSQSSLRWLQSQRSLADNYFKYIPYREPIRNRLAALWNYERQSTPIKSGAYYYFLKNDGLQNQDALYRASSLDGRAEAVLDPNTATRESRLVQFSFAKDGSLLAYEMADPNSKWSNIYLKSLDGVGRLLPDTLRWVKSSSISWYRDGFFYSRYPAPEEGQPAAGLDLFHQVYYHKAGTPQAEDELVFADRRDPLRRARTQCTEDERFLVLTTYDTSAGNGLFFRDLQSDELAFTPIADTFAHEFILVGNDDTNFYVLTDYQAPNKRLLKISALAPAPRYWQEVIPQSNDMLLEAHLFGGKIVAHYLHRASSQAKVFSLQGQEERVIPLPEIGTLQGFKGQQGSSELFYGFTSLVRPITLYRYDLNTGEQAAYWQPVTEFDSDAYEIKQDFYKSYDQVEIPIFIVHRRGLLLDGARPSLLCGYGAYQQPLLPVFDPTGYLLFPLILENGGVCAIANVRGGGEFGPSWHAAGRLHRKQNSFDDFQAAAEHLITKKYTSARKLAIHGTGPGGLLVGACLTQRPDLFAVALPAAGLFDMLHYQRMGGAAWASEYGRSDQESDFSYLLAYSPQHNLSPTNYPATLVLADVPGSGVARAHSYKFTAALQANQRGMAPVLLRPGPVSAGAGNTANRRIEEGADMLSFMFFNLKEGFKIISKQE
jgi:prolyl oligopeptidase